MKDFAFDARYIRLEHPDGISRFSEELISELFLIDSEFTVIISDLRVLDRLPENIKWVWLNRPDSIFERFAALRLNQHKFQVVFSPMQTIGSFGKKFKLILTLHDLIYYSHPEPPKELPGIIRILWRLYHLSFWPQRQLLKKADSLVTVSETTSDLVIRHKLYRANPVVVHNAVKITPREAKRERSVVYMGSFMPYKNIATLIRAAGLLPDHTFHLLSGISKRCHGELAALATSVGANCIFHDGVEEELYLELLASATALVHPSMDEGFGIPVVEAMASGIPVVISDIPIFREVAGKAGIFFDPRSPDELADCLIEAEQNWEHYRALSLEQAKQYSWRRSATELRELVAKLTQ